MTLNLTKLIMQTICLLTIFVSYPSCQASIATQKLPEKFPNIEKNLVLDFPRDHGKHDKYRIEWWYLTANLEDQDQEPLGAQWTLFRMALNPKKNKEKGWESTQIWMGHAALTSKNFHFSAEKFARDDVLQADVKTKPFEAWIDDWSLKGSSWNKLTVSANGENFKYFLELDTEGPIIKHGANGRSVKSLSGQASAYYSQPFFNAKGWIESNGERKFVTGSAWADHEWSSQFISETQEGWDWFSLNLNSGEKIMLFQVREKNKNHFYAGTWIDANGTHKPIHASQIAIKPVEPKGATGYYTKWTVKVTNLGLDINISALNEATLMHTNFPYWEGPISFTGSHFGNGYLEMTGYVD